MDPVVKVQQALECPPNHDHVKEGKFTTSTSFWVRAHVRHLSCGKYRVTVKNLLNCMISSCGKKSHVCGGIEFNAFYGQSVSIARHNVVCVRVPIRLSSDQASYHKPVH